MFTLSFFLPFIENIANIQRLFYCDVLVTIININVEASPLICCVLDCASLEKEARFLRDVNQADSHFGSV